MEGRPVLPQGDHFATLRQERASFFMNVSESHGLVPSVVGFAISAALLWIGSEVFAAARARAGTAMRRLQACALVLAGCGVWWPGHFAGVADEAGFTLLGLSVGGVLAWTLAGVAFLTSFARAPRSGRGVPPSRSSSSRRHWSASASSSSRARSSSS
jgi:hypothetical protein